ncbi:MAG TPA: hypothetical protein DCP61_02585 [Treponema sp.]|nr:hypothetical protein [Treponema sp.]
MKKILGAFLIASTFIFASCSSGSESGTSVDNKQEEQSTTENTNSSGVKPVAPTLTEIVVPQNLKVELNSADIKKQISFNYNDFKENAPKVFFTVSWEPVENATEYYVYTAATNEFTEDTPLNKTVTEPSVQLELNLGQKEIKLDNSYVAVKAHNSDYNLTSDLSSSVTCISNFLKSASYGSSSDMKDGKYWSDNELFVWSNVSGASKYKIVNCYRHTNSHTGASSEEDWGCRIYTPETDGYYQLYPGTKGSKFDSTRAYVTLLAFDENDILLGVSNRGIMYMNKFRYY